MYIAFDCLHVNGHSLLRRPLEERQGLLRVLKPALDQNVIMVNEAFSGTVIFREFANAGLEGIVAKRERSLYRPESAAKEWLKIPMRHREEFVVGGYLARTPDHLSALVVGQYEAGKLRYAGLVGTGLSEDTWTVMEFQATARTRFPFVPVPTLQDYWGELRTDLPPHWVQPTLVVEVEYRQRLADGLRHAALKGIRPEKDVREVVGQDRSAPRRSISYGNLKVTCHGTRRGPASEWTAHDEWETWLVRAVSRIGSGAARRASTRHPSQTSAWIGRP